MMCLCGGCGRRCGHPGARRRHAVLHELHHRIAMHVASCLEVSTIIINNQLSGPARVTSRIPSEYCFPRLFIHLYIFILFFFFFCASRKISTHKSFRCLNWQLRGLGLNGVNGRIMRKLRPIESSLQLRNDVNFSSNHQKLLQSPAGSLVEREREGIAQASN